MGFLMRQWNKALPRVIMGVFAIAVFSVGVFVFAESNNISAEPPDPRAYAPNFWFDSTEQYYPTTPFFYSNNFDEISGKKSKEEYENLSLEEKLSLFTVYYNFINEGNEWVYQYWLYYAYDEFDNEHWHDWESVFIFVDKKTEEINTAIGSAHGNFPVFFENVAYVDQPSHPRIPLKSFPSTLSTISPPR